MPDARRPLALPLPPEDVAAALASPMMIAGYGGELLQAVERALAHPGRGEAAQRLVDEMGNIRQAMQASDAGATRRAAGLLGRLLGRDVEAQAQAEQLASQLDVCLLRADAAAHALQAQAATQLEQAGDADVAADMIGRWADAGTGALLQGMDEALQMPLQRRLQHLLGIAALRRNDAAQLRLLQAQSVELIERYKRIRDVLLPVWRQQVAVAQAADMATHLQQAAESQARILDEVTAMQARLR